MALEGKRAVAALVRAATTQRDPLVARAEWEAASPWVGRVSAAAGRVFDSAREDALAFMSFPEERWRRVRTNNVHRQCEPALDVRLASGA